MTGPKDEFTATLGRLRGREVLLSRPGAMRLRIDDPTGTRELVVSGHRLTAGSAPANDVVLHDDAVSRVHFELELAATGATLRDLGSKNGTWLGPKIRVQEVWITPNATITTGSCSVELIAVDGVEVPTATGGRFGDMHGQSTKMGELFAKLLRLSELPLDVLVLGETGTGKELVARGLHDQSPRNAGPFVVLDCTNLNEGIAESTLFGHRKGTFTGAHADKPGLLEQAHGGTLFIDEIGELPRSLQPKLLRALENHETRRVGETAYRRFDARIVAATHRDLRRMVNDDTFRADLYFRLAQMQLELPPLRERGRGDITLLADAFLDRLSGQRDLSLRFTSGAYEALVAYAWPGNVRELRNAVRYAAMWAQGDKVQACDLPPPIGTTSGEQPAPTGTLSRTTKLADSLLLPLGEARLAFDRVYVERVLAEVGDNQSEAARRIGMSRSALRELLKRVGILGD